MRMTWVAMVWVLVAGGCAEDKAQTRETSTTASEEATAAAQTAAATAAADSPERHDAVERLFARKATDLQTCWSEEYEKTKNRKLEGDVTVQLNVAPSGQANDVRIVKSSLANPSVEKCVVKAVNGWSFPEGKGTMPVLRTVHLGAQF
jgi:TonB family protein